MGRVESDVENLEFAKNMWKSTRTKCTQKRKITEIRVTKVSQSRHLVDLSGKRYRKKKNVKFKNKHIHLCGKVKFVMPELWSTLLCILGMQKKYNFAYWSVVLFLRMLFFI